MSDKPGNILSNVSPPTELPSFVKPVEAPLSPTKTSEPFIEKTFSPAIPSEVAQPISNLNRLPPLNMDPVAQALSPITQSSSALFGWMKGAVSNNQILQRVAETAKSSVDSLVYTLDPQMKDYLHTTGLELIVASDKDDKIRPIKEAFLHAFGKTVVTGIGVQAEHIAAQPVGLASALKGAEERIANVKKIQPNGMPIIAIEAYIVEQFPGEWFEASLIVLHDIERQQVYKSVTQMTPLPLDVVTELKVSTPDDYEHLKTGFATTVGSVMAKKLSTHHTTWHEQYTTVNRSEMLANAAKTLASLYKQYLLSVDVVAANNPEQQETSVKQSPGEVKK